MNMPIKMMEPLGACLIVNGNVFVIASTTVTLIPAPAEETSVIWKKVLRLSLVDGFAETAVLPILPQRCLVSAVAPTSKLQHLPKQSSQKIRKNRKESIFTVRSVEIRTP